MSKSKTLPLHEAESLLQADRALTWRRDELRAAKVSLTAITHLEMSPEKRNELYKSVNVIEGLIKVLDTQQEAINARVRS